MSLCPFVVWAVAARACTQKNKNSFSLFLSKIACRATRPLSFLSDSFSPPVGYLSGRACTPAVGATGKRRPLFFVRSHRKQEEEKKEAKGRGAIPRTGSKKGRSAPRRLTIPRPMVDPRSTRHRDVENAFCFFLFFFGRLQGKKKEKGKERRQRTRCDRSMLCALGRARRNGCGWSR